jgi:hypothetical protein
MVGSIPPGPTIAVALIAVAAVNVVCALRALHVLHEYRQKLRDPRFTCAAIGMHDWRFTTQPMPGPNRFTAFCKLECASCKTQFNFDLNISMADNQLKIALGPRSAGGPHG